jgi:hypothetical protein
LRSTSSAAALVNLPDFCAAMVELGQRLSDDIVSPLMIALGYYKQIVDEAVQLVAADPDLPLPFSTPLGAFGVKMYNVRDGEPVIVRLLVGLKLLPKKTAKAVDNPDIAAALFPKNWRASLAQLDAEPDGAPCPRASEPESD